MEGWFFFYLQGRQAAALVQLVLLALLLQMLYFRLPFYVGVPAGFYPLRDVLEVWRRNIVLWSALDYNAERFFIRLLTFAVGNFAQGLSLVERGL